MQIKVKAGVTINLTGDEVAMAIVSYLSAQGVQVSGPRTVSVNGDLCREGSVFVDPLGRVALVRVGAGGGSGFYCGTGGSAGDPT